MIEFENKIEIQKPIKEVFDFVGDFENLPKWNYFVVEVNKTSEGPVAQNSTFHQKRKIDNQEFQIIEYKYPETILIKTISDRKPWFERRFIFKSLGEMTRLTDQWKLDTGKPRILESIGKNKAKTAVMNNLQKLKTLLETGKVELQDGRMVQI
jgi:hypothetical protein